MSKKSLDLKSLCRTCMSNRARISSGINASKSRLHISEKPTGCWNEGLTIMELLQYVQPKIQVHIRDKLPKIVCHDCIEHLHMTYEFLNMCKDTDDKFRKMLKEDDTSEDDHGSFIDPVLGYIVDEVECKVTKDSTSNHHPEFESMFINNKQDGDDYNGDMDLSDNPFGNDSDDENDDGASMESRPPKKSTIKPGSSSKRVMSEYDSPSKKIKRDNKHASNSCCNCEAIEENVDQINVTMNQVKGQLKLAITALAEQKMMLKKLLRQQCEDIPLQRKFPLATEEQVEEINSEITEENRNAYIKAMRPLLHPLPKNLQNILSDEVIAAYNIDGIHGKLSFKALTNFYGVLLDAIPYNDESGPAEEQLRKAIRLQKKRYMKRMSVARSKSDKT